MDLVSCYGNESGLSHCQHAGWGVPNDKGFGYCERSREASVVCSASKLKPVSHFISMNRYTLCDLIYLPHRLQYGRTV